MWCAWYFAEFEELASPHSTRVLCYGMHAFGSGLHAQLFCPVHVGMLPGAQCLLICLKTVTAMMTMMSMHVGLLGLLRQPAPLGLTGRVCASIEYVACSRRRRPAVMLHLFFACFRTCCNRFSVLFLQAPQPIHAPTCSNTCFAVDACAYMTGPLGERVCITLSFFERAYGTNNNQGTGCPSDNRQATQVRE